MKRSILGLITSVTLTLFAGSSAFAQNETWNGGSDWTTGTWLPGFVPPGATVGSTTNTDTAFFTAPLTEMITVDAGRNIENITFDTEAGAYTLSGGPLVLTSGGTIELGTTATSFTGTNTAETIDTPIVLEGNYNFTNNSTTASDVLDFGPSGTITNGTTNSVTLTLGNANTGANTLAGAITNGGATTSLNMSGPGNWILSSGANSFGGATISGGTLQLGNANAMFNNGTGGGVTVNSTNGLTFSAGIGTFNVAGLSGSSDESLLDVSGNAITLQLGNLYEGGGGRDSYSYGGILSDAGGEPSNVTIYGYILETFSSDNTYSGTTTISGVNSGDGLGTLETTLATNGTPFGTGSVVLNNGILELAPSGTGSDIDYTGATATGSTVTYAGNAYILLNKGTQNSVTYTIGSGSGTALQRSGTGSLIIQTANSDLGLGEGAGENLIIAPGSDVPIETNGIVSPTIVGISGAEGSNGFYQTDFLSYNATTGFTVATNYVDYTTSFSTVANEIENVNFALAGGTITQGTGNAYAMVINSSTVTPTIDGTIDLGNGSGQAGLILESNINNAQFVTGGEIDFGGAEGVITVSGGGGYSSINTQLAGTGGITIMGPEDGVGSGFLQLLSSNTFSGGLTLNGVNLAGFLSNGSFGDVTNTVTFNGGGLIGGSAMVAGRSAVLGIGGGILNPTNQLLVSGWNFSGSGSLTTTGSETVLAGNNTYTGGTIISGFTAISSDANIGGANAPIVFADNYGDESILSIIGTEMTGFGAHPVTVVYNTGVSQGNAGQTSIGFDLQDPDETFTVTQALNSGNAGFNKYGPGTLVIDAPLTTGAPGANGIAIDLYGGVMEVNGAAGGSIVLTNNLTFAGGTLDIIGNSSGATTANFGAVTVTGQGSSNGQPTAGGGSSTLVVDSGTGSGTTVNLGVIGTGIAGGGTDALLTPGTTLDIVAATEGSGVSTITTTSAPDTSTGNTEQDGSGTATSTGIYGARVVYTDSGGNVNWATSTLNGSGTYTLSGYNDYIDLAASFSIGGPEDNVIVTGTDTSTLSTGVPNFFNSLKISNSSSGTLSLGGNPLVLTSGGLLFTGTAAFTVGDSAGGTLVAGSPTGSGNTDLVVQDYGTAPLTISAVIADADATTNFGINSGTSASTLTKAGPGTLILSGTNTYTGQTYVVGGVLSISSDNNLGGGNGTISIASSTAGSATVTLNSATLPAGFGVGSSLLGQTVNSISGATVTLNGGASVTITTPSMESWATANTINLNGGTLQVTATTTLSESNAAVGTVGGAQTQNRNIILGSNGGTFDVINGSTLTILGNLSAPANFNGGGDGSLTLTSSDNNAADTLIIDGNGNSFSEGVTIDGGTLQTNNELFGGGADTLTFGNATATVETLMMNNNSATIAGLTGDSANAVIENNSGSGSATLTDLQGGDTTYAGTLIDGVSGGTLNFLKTGGGTLSLTNAGSSYTGYTEIDNGVLNVASLGIQTGTAGATDSSIGASSNAASNLIFGGTTNGSAALQYTGSTAQTTDRLFTLGDSNGTDATLDASGSSPSATVSFINTGSIAISTAATNGSDPHNLTLTGTNTGTAATMNTFAPLLVDGGAPTSLSKTGTGSWAVTNANTYSGGTTVSGGTLYANYDNSVTPGSSTGTGTVAVTSGGTLSGTGAIAPAGANGITLAAGGNLAPGGVQSGSTVNGSLTLDTTNIAPNSTILAAGKDAGLTFAVGAGAPNDPATVSQLLVTGGVNNVMNFNIGGTSGIGGTSTVITINDLDGPNLAVAVDPSTEYILIVGNDTIYEDNGQTLQDANDLGAYNAALNGYQILGGLTLLVDGSNYFSENYPTSDLYLVGDDIVLTVPEPSTWALMLGGLGLLVFFQRRKYNKTC